MSEADINHCLSNCFFSIYYVINATVMKAIKNHLRPIAIFLVSVMLIENCTVYKTPITLDQAVQNKSKVRVKTETAENFKFHKIVAENGNYYGIKKSEGKTIKMPLDEKFIISIKEQDKSASTLATILLVVESVGVVIIAAFLISGVGPALDFSWE